MAVRTLPVLEDEQAIVYYTGNGVQTFFEFVFEMDADSEVLVVVNGTLATNYQAQGYGIRFFTPPPYGANIVIMRITEVTQVRDWNPFDAFEAEKTELAADKLILLKQEAKLYRANMNIFAVQHIDGVSIVNAGGADAFLPLWHAALPEAGTFNGELTEQAPPDGAPVTEPQSYLWFQWDSDSEPPIPPSGDFVTVWRTTAINESITLPLFGTGYNATVNWGDGTPDSLITSDVDPDRIHIYAATGEHTVTIRGVFPRIYCLGTGGNASRTKLIRILNWGAGGWTTMHGAFSGCSNLVEVSAPDDIAGVALLGLMFNGCINLTSLNFAHWDTSSVTSLESTFESCTKLTSIVTTGWDTSNVTNMSKTFRNCSKLALLDLAHWDTSSATSMSYMFELCVIAHTINTNGWNTSNVTTMSGMFNDCELLQVAHVSSFDTSKVTSTSLMFRDCRAMVLCDVSGFNTSNVTFMAYMFESCGELVAVDVSGFDTAKVSAVNGFERMFFACVKLTTIDVSNWDVGLVKSLLNTFHSCAALTTLDVSNWNTSSVTTMEGTFNGCSALTPLNIANWNTANVTTMRSMFIWCMSLTDLDVSLWDVSKVVDYQSTFYGCQGMTTFNVANWNTAIATHMNSMFGECSSLVTLNVSSWNVANMQQFSSMFSECPALTTLNVSAWNVANVTQFVSMFEGCSSLHTLDVSNWNTIKATSMLRMFNMTGALNPEVSGFDMGLVTQANFMFGPPSGLTNENYGELLIAWAAQSPSLKNNVPFQCVAKYPASAATARGVLTGTHGWIISDGGPE